MSRFRPVSIILGGSGVAIALLVLVAAVFLIRGARQDAIVAGAAAGCALVLGFTYIVLKYRAAQRQLPAELKPGMKSAERSNHAKAALRILVAEDDPMNRSIVELLLQRLGHTTVVVENGALAVEAVKSSEPFDIALLDIQMPVMGGLAAARRIRSIEGPRGRLRLVAMTAQAGEQEIASANRAGFSATLSKPFAEPELQALLQATSEPSARTGSPG